MAPGVDVEGAAHALAHRVCEPGVEDTAPGYRRRIRQDFRFLEVEKQAHIGGRFHQPVGVLLFELSSGIHHESDFPGDRIRQSAGYRIPVAVVEYPCRYDLHEDQRGDDDHDGPAQKRFGQVAFDRDTKAYRRSHRQCPRSGSVRMQHIALSPDRVKIARLARVRLDLAP